MPHYFAIDATANDWNGSPISNYREHRHQHRVKAHRARSGSISVSNFDNFAASPVNRLAQSLGPECTKQNTASTSRRHTHPTMNTRRGHYFVPDALDPLYEAKSNRRSIWQRLADNVDRCVFRVVEKFYYK